jgi:hypothetical protein
MKKPKKTNPTEFTEETALGFFARHLDGLKWKYRRTAEGNALFSGFNGDDALWDFIMAARNKGENLYLLEVTSFVPNKARAERRSACMEVLSRLNTELSLGCFELNHETGEIRFRTSVALPAADITEGIAEHLIRSNLAIVDGHLKQILAVLYSDITPAEALKPKSEKTETRFELN